MSVVAGRIIAMGAISAALAVAFGAFGAHALEGRVPAELLRNWNTGAQYHFYHSLGMLAIGLLALRRADSMRLRLSAVLMLTGVVLFSGSLYTMTLTGSRWLGAVTPFGGIAFLAAWALFAWEAVQTSGGGNGSLGNGSGGKGGSAASAGNG